MDEAKLSSRTLAHPFRALGIAQNSGPWTLGSASETDVQPQAEIFFDVNGLSSGNGSWEDPDRVTKEVVGDCQMFLEDDALQPSPLPRSARG
jgi:hypothetical protein